MRKQVLIYSKPAGELKEGDQIMSSRHTIVGVVKTELFRDTRSRPCVEVNLEPNEMEQYGTLIFGAKEFVLTVE